MTRRVTVVTIGRSIGYNTFSHLSLSIQKQHA
jgi:hypothetical protein